MVKEDKELLDLPGWLRFPDASVKHLGTKKIIKAYNKADDRNFGLKFGKAVQKKNA